MESSLLNFEKRRTKVKYCPCGKKNNDGKFAPYIGYDNKGYCHSCGELFLPEKNTSIVDKKYEPLKPVSTSYHDPQLIAKTGRNFKENNFVQFLKSIFSPDEVKQAILKYCIGTSRHWKGSNIFWQIDNYNNVRHGKVMLYDQITGKRSTSETGKAFISSVRSILKLNDFNLKQCLYGLHQINEKETRTIAVCEGEKTSIMMSIFKPEYVWMATGSKVGFKYEMLKPIKGYNIIAFPDKSEYYHWSDIAAELNSVGFKITVNDWIEGLKDYNKGTDLADVYLDTKKSEELSNRQPLQQKTSTNELIFSNLETDVGRLAIKNPNIYLLIDAFGLTDENGFEIRKY